jgi:HSP20 family protein
MALPSLLDEIDRLFDELIRRPWGGATPALVPAEIREVEDGWLIEMPVEGMRATDLRLEVQGRQLLISGQRRHVERRQGKGGWSGTQRQVSFHRSVTLPANANPNDIDAKIEGATLAIHIGKRRP